MLKDVQALARVPFVSDLPLAEVNRLAEALDVVELAMGEALIVEGDTDDCLYIVLDGELVVSTRASGVERSLWTKGAGDIVGALSAIDNAPRIATCRALRAARVGRLTRERYRALTGDSARLGLAFQQAIGVQLARECRWVAKMLEPVVTPREAPRRPAAVEKSDADVAIIGGGPLGMIYAQWLVRMRPGTRVTILERREVPGFKIGESTLSTTVRAFRAMGFTMPQLRRLFGNKAGIRFWWAGSESARPERHVDIVDIEETFQIERRVFEIALQRLTRAAGVDLRLGAQVDLDDSELDGPVKTLACTSAEGRPERVSARVVCDATGPAALLPRHLGTYRKDPKVHDTFQTNSYFGYFRQKRDVPLAHWQEAATRHLCFREGWVWFITVHSWERADDQTLQQMVDDILDHSNADDAAVPPRRYFENKHGIEHELVTSIGITVRDDLDTAKDLPIQQRFLHYVERYPALRFILDHYELIEQPYREKRRPYAAFLGLVHDSTQVAGDGWLAIGDSAQFSNPLFSHGLNYGTGGAYIAARATAAALDRNDISRSAFSDYERYCERLFVALLHQTDFFYRSWAHPKSFERTLQVMFYWGAIDVSQRDEYSDTDPYTLNPLDPSWRAMIRAVRDIEKRFELSEVDAETMADEVAAVVDPFIAACAERARALGIDMGALMTDFVHDNVRVEGRTEKPRGFFRAYQCPTCHLWEDDTLERCPVCGTRNPDRHLSQPAAAPKATAEPGPISVALSSRRSVRRPRTAQSITVLDVVDETDEARSFVLDVDRNDFAYTAGQFVTLEVDVNGETFKRCYSLSSAPALDPVPRFTVKRVRGGVVSNWLCDHVQRGDTLRIHPADGRFVASPERRGDLFLFAAGSGITPIYSIAAHALAASDRNVRLVTVDRSEREAIFRDRLLGLREQHGRRLKLVQRLGSRDGRIDTRDVQAYSDELTDGLFFVCGPWGFMDVVEEALLDMGVDPDRLFVERFASPPRRLSTPNAFTESSETAAGASEVTLDVFGTQFVVPCEPDQTITQAALDAEIDVPLSCEEGFCGTCAARLVEGDVTIESDVALTRGQKKRGYVLACQVRPKSKRVTLRFEG